ncbi:uncharacterized protein BP01DRAFT_346755 [Aspergillus saccharolyticus JOP 1030-1]|uniref:BTB domain-containing protein n=1 Tax=Aspergillus saccharolyticus JOP 1030-1 TaxID=1450539 RepID=A0A318Z7Y1_9EURO|nr:hypothetical protein BP01DRAFT_346755 [Aspergillus saccharolyticus JOP 1030-1]PYH42534.1 hypothetical protein BP01DRAFT_346755 [Aspergillus saccharolyticus JOP 1030-1]
MREITHVIDPDGEVILLLVTSDAPFAVLHNDPEPASAPVAQGQGVRTAGEAGPVPSRTTPTRVPFIKEIPEPALHRIRVSAKHLTFASVVFEKTLSDKWKEGAELRDQGWVEIQTPHWDLDSFLLLLRIIHGHNDNVPVRMNVEQLARLAVIADYYDCRRVLGFFSSVWIDYLVGNTFTTYRDVMLWLWICWYFQIADEFSEITLFLMRRSDRPIESLGLPIPDNIIAQLNQKRDSSIQLLLDLLYGHLEYYRDGCGECGYARNSMMFGALAKHLRTMGLVLTPPKPPFRGFSDSSLHDSVRAFRLPEWHAARGDTEKHECVAVGSSKSLMRLNSLSMWEGLRIPGLPDEEESADGSVNGAAGELSDG